MALTTLLVCLQGTTPVPTRPRTIFKALSLGLAVMFLSALTACGSDGGSGGGPIITDPQGPGSGGFGAGGVSASLSWNPVQDANLIGYFVHYGRYSSGSSGSCSYEASTFTSTPSATVSGLAPNTTYFFSVSAYNGLESACSSEVSTVTSGETFG